MTKKNKHISNIIFLMMILMGIVLIIFKTYFGFKEGIISDIIINKFDSFCQAHSSSSITLDRKCNQLSSKNCNSTSCCVWTSNNKCTAGKSDGPTFNTDNNGKTKELDYYYYQNKCYGNGC